MKKRLLFCLTGLLLLLGNTSFGQNLEIYVSDAVNFSTGPFKILKFDENGENVDTFTNEELAWPQDILFLEDQGVALVSNLSTGRITKYAIDSGDYLGNFATGIGGPTRMKIGADSLLYVLQWSGNAPVLRYELDGTFVDEFTSVGVNQAIGLDWDEDGNLYVSSWGGASVRKFDTEGNDEGLFINSGLQGPTNVWFNEAGELLALNWSGTAAKRYDASGVFMDNFITGLSNPEGIAVHPNGNILIGDGGSSAVKLFDSEGNFLEDIITSGSGGLVFPNAVVLRDVPAPVSTEELIVELTFVQPTIGNAFYLDQTITDRLEWVEIYDASGHLIERNTVHNNEVWNASKYAEGLYIITAQSVEGKRLTQKIVVKR